MELSQSSIKLYKRCPQAYYYKKVKNLVPRLSALPLQRGIMLHSALETYYNGGFITTEYPGDKDIPKLVIRERGTWKDAILKYAPFWDSLLDEEKELYGGDLLNDCIGLMEGYCRQYGDKPKEKIIAVELDLDEHHFEILPGLFLKGRVDLVSEETEGPYKGIWLTEHKSHKKIPSEDSRFLNMQTVLYQEAVEKILGIELSGIRWNYLRTKRPTVPRTLVNGGLSRAKDIDTDYATYLQAIIAIGEDPMHYKEELERAKQNEFYVRRYTPKNPQVTRAIIEDIRNVAPVIDRLANYPYRCLDTFICKSCSYKIICQAELLGLDTSFILKKDFKVDKEVKNDGNYDEE